MVEHHNHTKLFWILGVVAGLLFMGVLIARQEGRGGAQIRHRQGKTGTEPSRTVSIVTQPSTPETNVSEHQPVRKQGLPVPPENHVEEPKVLHAWLLGLPNCEFKSLIGTEELDRYVGFVCTTLNESTSETEQFLAQLNARITEIGG